MSRFGIQDLEDGSIQRQMDAGMWTSREGRGFTTRVYAREYMEDHYQNDCHTPETRMRDFFQWKSLPYSKIDNWEPLR